MYTKENHHIEMLSRPMIRDVSVINAVGIQVIMLAANIMPKTCTSRTCFFRCPVFILFFEFFFSMWLKCLASFTLHLVFV